VLRGCLTGAIFARRLRRSQCAFLHSNETQTTESRCDMTSKATGSATKPRRHPHGDATLFFYLLEAVTPIGAGLIAATTAK
jgi:hypothetical protein